MSETEPTQPPEEDASQDQEPIDLISGRLLDVLLYKGVLPRYAFPTDVASFFVFDVAASQYNRPEFRHSPQQGLTIALSQYAPGKEVWIAGQRFISGAIYSPYREERRDAWEKRRLYYECERCGNTITKPLNAGERGERLTCDACSTVDSLGPARLWFRPPGFAHPVDLDPGVSADEEPAHSRPTRARLEAPAAPSSDPRWRDHPPRLRALHTRESLLVTNSGPRREGYNYCVACGRIEPAATRNSRLLGAHKKPFPDARRPECPGRVAREVCLGTDYITDILLLQISVEAPVELKPGVLGTEVALRTLSEALSNAASRVLELEAGELQAEFRPAVSPAGREGRMAEIFMYDSLAGGAGFARQVGDELEAVLDAAEQILGNCTCNSSCYRCLRSFKNRFEHSKLHRLIGLELLQHLRRGTDLIIPEQRVRRAAMLLAEDIGRQMGSETVVELNKPLDDPDVGAVVVPLTVTSGRKRAAVCITHVLAPTTPPTREQRELAEFSTTPVVCLHELLVERALPQASQRILASLGVK